MEEKAGVKKQNFKNGFEKNENARVEGVGSFRFQCLSVLEAGRPNSDK